MIDYISSEDNKNKKVLMVVVVLCLAIVFGVFFYYSGFSTDDYSLREPKIMKNNLNFEPPAKFDGETDEQYVERLKGAIEDSVPGIEVNYTEYKDPNI